jgi:hypothetical protein
MSDRGDIETAIVTGLAGLTIDSQPVFADVRALPTADRPGRMRSLRGRPTPAAVVTVVGLWPGQFDFITPSTIGAYVAIAVGADDAFDRFTVAEAVIGTLSGMMVGERTLTGPYESVLFAGPDVVIWQQTYRAEVAITNPQKPALES